MNVLLTLLLAFWGFRIVANILSYAQLWRVKEYRYDRMMIHLRTAQGKQFLFPPWKRPAIAPKTIALIAGTCVILAGIYVSLPFSYGIKLAIIDVLSFPVTFIIIGVVYLPTLLYHRYVIGKAVAKLRAHTPMIVVGITGSFGKTSVKEYLSTILSTQYRVLKTAESKNSPIGIAEVIQSSLRPEHEIFVVEMGAYKMGEIATMTAMVQPQIGIITAINPQHQDLFGSLDITMQAKYELLAGLSGKKIALVNADNERTRTMGDWAKRDGCDVWQWTKEGTKYSDGPRFWADNIVADSKGVVFDAHFGKEVGKVRTRVLGEHQAGNILAAIAAAVACGMDFRKAVRAASSIQAAAKVMQVVEGIAGSTFINDTFNNNPDAAKAAISYLGSRPNKKILVFQPMIELGEFALPSHTEVGAYAAKHADAILLTNRNFYAAFEQGVRSVSQTVPLMVVTPKQGAAFIRERISSGDTVLFKGKEAEHVLHALSS